MPLASMTGFARAQGVAGTYGWTWELKSVNARGFDLRLRLPAGWEGVEPAVRSAASRLLSRGSVSATLEVAREGAAPTIRINEEALAAILEAFRRIAARVGTEPPRLDSLLSVKGVVEVVETEEDETEHRKAEAAVTAGFDEALAALVAAREAEGATLTRVLDDKLGEIAKLVEAAEGSPARQPEAVRARLAEQIKALLDTDTKFDADRLHQEAVMLAAKADVREEIDRLAAHVAAARDLLAQGGPIGRRLDFLAQELNREANTLCAKASDVSLSTIGLELKAAVDQFREQVQNIE